MKMKRNLLLIVLVSLVLVLPFHQAQAAGFWDGFGIALSKIITGLFDLYTAPWVIGLQVAQMITGILPAISGELFRVALNLNEIIPLTPAGAGSTDMVTVGYNFTRDIANMLFVLILAWVGFATMLRLETYEIKKIIPKLIIVALLINFIPVICGVILDIASVITKTFADKSTGIALYMWKLLPGVSMIQKGTESLTALIPGQGGISGMAVASLTGIAFNLIAAFMLSLYGLIFLTRIVAIWILIVLAPLAWLGFVIPQGKKMWDMWWKNFIQWAIIGVPLTFFLYLTTFVLSSSSFVCDINNAEAFKQYGFLEGLLTSIVGENLICNTLPFIAGVIVMLVGFILSITFAPQGADKILQGAKKGGLAAGKVLGTQAWKGIKESATYPAKAVRDYQMARTMGLSRGQSFGAAISRPARTWRRWRPSLPAAPIRTYRTARALGMPRRDAFRAAIRRWNDWTPSGPKTREVINGFKNAVKIGWATGMGGKAKKKGTRTCPTCGNTRVAASAANCPTCGHVF